MGFQKPGTLWILSHDFIGLLRGGVRRGGGSLIFPNVP